MRLVLFDREVTVAARTERAFRLGFDHGGARNLDRAGSGRARFEFELLLTRASKWFTQNARAWVDRKILRFGAGHSGTGVRPRRPLLFNHPAIRFKAGGFEPKSRPRFLSSRARITALPPDAAA